MNVEAKTRRVNETRAVAVDFEFASEQDFDRLAQSLNGLDVAILGMFIPTLRLFHFPHIFASEQRWEVARNARLVCGDDNR